MPDAAFPVRAASPRQYAASSIDTSGAFASPFGNYLYSYLASFPAPWRRLPPPKKKCGPAPKNLLVMDPSDTVSVPTGLAACRFPARRDFGRFSGSPDREPTLRRGCPCSGFLRVAPSLWAFLATIWPGFQRLKKFLKFFELFSARFPRALVEPILCLAIVFAKCSRSPYLPMPDRRY